MSRPSPKSFEDLSREYVELCRQGYLLDQISSLIEGFSNHIETRRPDRMIEFAQFIGRLMQNVATIKAIAEELDQEGRLIISVRYYRKRKPEVFDICL